MRQKLTHWIGWLVLLNIGVGFCDCLRDPISLPANSTNSATLTTNTDRQAPPECGDNCESCVCHASVVTVEPARFSVDLPTARLTSFPVLSPSDPDQVRVELTAGVTEDASIGVMQLNARRPGGLLQSAGWRLVPHLYVPRSWHLPVDFGLVVEFAFENPTLSVTILPILEKRFGRVQIDLNPTFGRSPHGPDTDRGWGLGLAGRVAFEQTKRFTPSLEYYGDWGALPAFEPFAAQMHRILPGGDIRLRKNIVWSTAVGVGLTPATDRLVFKSRLEISFGGRTKH